MDKIKCGQCGLVSWQGARECARCKASLTVSSGVNPYESDPTPAVNSFVKIGLLVLVLGGVGFGVYKAAMPAEQPKPAVVAQEMQLDQKAVQQMMMDEQKKDAERMAKMQAEWKQTPPAFDKQRMKELMDKSAKQYAANMQRQNPPR